MTDDARAPVDLHGKVAIVTGASAGIGRAYALALAGAGATVIAAARTLGRLDDGPAARNTLAEVVATGAALPGSIYAQVCDMEIEADVVRMVDQAVVNLGRIDVLVNNAAVMGGFPLDASSDDWDRVMRTNVRGPYLAIREVSPSMIRQRAGSIINITARAGNFVSMVSDGTNSLLLYAVSKAALNRLTNFMADELAPHGIAVNALSPGRVLTDTAAAARPEARAAGTHKPATPEVLGPALLYLAQRTAESLTGQILETDEFQKSWP
jgi:3-oxoacyl-[acyl-carrier protein] reductase